MKAIELNTPLTVDEIDFRIQSISHKGWATILAYKDARVDMKRLDDVFGVEFWQKKYSVINNNLFCSVGIYNQQLQEWIWKEDVGTESMTEKEKGQASDAFKRACFNLGIGRELYDYPRIFLQLKDNEFVVKQVGNKKIGSQTYDLKLDKWTWEVDFKDGKPTKVTAHDQNGALRFDSTKDFNTAPQGNEPKKEEKPLKQNTATVPPDVLNELAGNLAEIDNGEDLKVLFKNYAAQVKEYPTLKAMFTARRIQLEKVAANGNA